MVALGTMTGWAQTALPAGVDQIVKLSQAKMGDDVVLTYIRNNNLSCALNADQIIYLSGQGVSQAAIAALMQSAASTASAPSAAPAATAPVVTTPAVAPAVVAPAAVPAVVASPTVVATTGVTVDAFHAQLASYGTWMQVEGYGLCWRPAELVAFPAWRPYCDRGHWVYTEDGWFWKSDYPWGDVVFHYGRWYRDVRFGWLWIPDTTWGPAWVCWRHTDGYCGWAPLPPAARFQAGIGWTFNGRVGVELDFGLVEDHFVFVGYDRFWETDFHLFLLPRERVRAVFGGSVVMNHYRMEKNHFVFEGIGPDRIGKFTRHDMRPVATPRGAFGGDHRDDRHDARPGGSDKGRGESPRNNRR
jgi:hypothetical protein